MQNQANRLLTHYELAQELGVSPRHVQRLADNGTIPEIRISKLVRRYCLPAVLEALETQGRREAANA
ncbi:MAG: helix-turn-helix domain-containing protein [Planctomycetaceae bacterium]|nr:helix-turn-helix domain-containing protein [Planctomycetaceae bacterium]